MGCSSWQLRISIQQAVDREACLLSFHGIAPQGLPIVYCIWLTKDLESKIGVVDDRTSASDYDNDMQQAKAAGIDAFALNIGTDGEALFWDISSCSRLLFKSEDIFQEQIA